MSSNRRAWLIVTVAFWSVGRRLMGQILAFRSRPARRRVGHCQANASPNPTVRPLIQIQVKPPAHLKRPPPWDNEHLTMLQSDLCRRSVDGAGRRVSRTASACAASSSSPMPGCRTRIRRETLQAGAACDVSRRAAVFSGGPGICAAVLSAAGASMGDNASGASAWPSAF